MTYREPPNKEELFQMLKEANKEKAASNKRVRELEEKLAAITVVVEQNHRKFTHIDVSDMSTKELEKVVNDGWKPDSETTIPQGNVAKWAKHKLQTIKTKRVRTGFNHWEDIPLDWPKPYILKSSGVLVDPRLHKKPKKWVKWLKNVSSMYRLIPK